MNDDPPGAPFSALYSTTVTVDGGEAGHGRASGRARSADGVLDIRLRLPAELGGDGEGTNPEQLFAAGFAACFHAALSLVALRAGVSPAAISVAATIAFGRDPADGGYQLRADLLVTWPGVDEATAAPLLAQADSLCPYARMARQGAPATIRLAT